VTEFRPAEAYWNSRDVLAKSRQKILKLIAAVGRDYDLRPFQWAQLMATAMEFSPDLILELGRGYGNSTAAFTEAAHLMGSRPRIQSVCLSSDWDNHIAKAIGNVVGKDWFTPLTAVTGNILDYDYAAAFRGAQRVLVFWDAHGFDIAECVFGTILPILADRPHLVIMHDLSDARYGGPNDSTYGGQRIWRGNNWSGPRVRLGNIDSAVEQSIAAVDFTSRNNLTLDSADHSFHTELSIAQVREMEATLGELFSPSAHWFYFTLNERKGPYYFPAPAPLRMARPEGVQTGASGPKFDRSKSPDGERFSRLLAAAGRIAGNAKRLVAK
jgi:hypothetical protein